jgi:hypothetical protein
VVSFDYGLCEALELEVDYTFKPKIEISGVGCNKTSPKLQHEELLE